MFENYKDSLFNDKIILRSQQRFRSDHHRVYTEEVNKISLSSNDDKRIQTYDKITTYPYGTNTYKICKNEMKYILQRKNNDSQSLRDKSMVLRNNTQALIDEAYAIRNNSQVLRDEPKSIRNNSQILRDEARALRNNTKALINR